MPGMFGVLSDNPYLVKTLAARWLSTWPHSRVHSVPGGAIGAHGFAESKALCHLDDGSILTVEGDVSAYAAVENNRGRLPPEVGRLSSRELVLASSFRGNAALLSPGAREIVVGTEWTGTFPLYLWQSGNALAFSSLLPALLAVASDELDPVGLSQYLSHSYTCNGHTIVRGVKRLLPGQSLRLAPETGIEVRECSTLWSEEPDMGVSKESAGRELFSLLSPAVRRGAATWGDYSLMMSAGWDSRLLLAAMKRDLGDSPIRTLSHGDTRGRELRLAKAISISSGAHHLERDITASVLDHEVHRTSFDRCGSALFPHWIESATALQAEGRTTVFSGVYGEILGGHYGETMVTHGASKVASLMYAMLGRPDTEREMIGGEPSEELTTLLGATPSVGRWYLRRDWLESYSGLTRRVRDSVKEDISRLIERGVSDKDQLIEAFVSEHRGSQRINLQALSARARGDVSLPFIDRELLNATLRLPISVRIHNQMTQSILRLCAPHLLNYPMAATLVSARRPILVQELSRFARMLGERSRVKLHNFTGGRVSKSRMGWVNFEFMVGSRLLTEAVSALSLEIWDKSRLLDVARGVENGTWEGRLHPLFDQLGKIFTVDLALRKHPQMS